MPKAHHSDAFHQTAEGWNDTYEILQRAKDYLDKKHAPDIRLAGMWAMLHQSILHSHLHVIPRYNDKPHAGKGLRHWLKQPDNKRGILKR